MDRQGRAPRSPGTATVVGAVLAALAVLATTACGRGAEPKVLHVYSARHYGFEPAFEAFTDRTGVQIELIGGTDDELRQRIVDEGAGGGADLYLSVDAANLSLAADQGVFRAIESPQLVSVLPAERRDPDDRWFALTVRLRTIAYSPERVPADQRPPTYADLADPRWAGRLCLGAPSGVYQRSLVAGLIAAHGEDRALAIVRGWAANATVVNNDELVLTSIAEGTCDVGVVNHYYLGRLLDTRPGFPVALLWADQADQAGRGLHQNLSGGGVTRHARQPELAQQLLEWLATEGQEPLVTSTHELPANPAVEPDPVAVGVIGSGFSAEPVRAAELARLTPAAVRIVAAAGFR